MVKMLKYRLVIIAVKRAYEPLRRGPDIWILEAYYSVSRRHTLSNGLETA